MVSKHTPGPRRFSSHPHDGNYLRIHFSRDPNGGYNLRGYCGEANARLIVAAPDLLVCALYEDARSRGEDIAETVLKRHGFNPKAESAQDFVDRIRRAAIAKVKGQQ